MNQIKMFNRILIFLFSILSWASVSQAQFALAPFWKMSSPRLNFSTVAQNIYTKNCSAATTVQTLNPAGVATNVIANLTVSLTSADAGLTFYSDSFCSQSITSVVIATGTSSASFYFSTVKAGSPVLKATATGYRDGTQTETITANPFVWIGGGGDANWATNANWSGGSAPGASNIAVFDNACVSNCSPTIASNISIGGIRLLSTYSGTITQSAGMTISVGSSHWYQQNGTFAGGNSAISIEGLLYILGGSFTSTSGTLSFATSYGSGTTVTVLKIANGVTFNANGGTIMDQSTYLMYASGVRLNLDVDTSVSFNNLSINPSQCNQWWYLTGNYGIDTHKAVNPITVNGTFNHACGWIGGEFKVSGNVIFGASSRGYGYDVGIVELNGTGAQTYTYTTGSGNGAILKINKASGSVQAEVGTTDLTLNGLDLTLGSFTAPSGALNFVIMTRSSLNFFNKSAGTTFSHNNGTINFNPYLYTCSGDINLDIKADDAVTFNNVTFTGANDNNCWGGMSNFNQPGAGTITIAGDAQILGVSGRLNGNKWDLQGNFTLSNSSFSGGTAALTFSGGNTQNINVTAGALPTGTVTVNKSGGSIVQLSNVNWSGASQALTIMAGTWDMNGKNLTVAGTLTNSGSLIKGANPTCGTLTYGSFSGNAATCP